MEIYAYGDPGEENREFIYQSLKDAQKPVSRFLYSYFSNCDLVRLKGMDWNKMNVDEQNCWHHANRLLNFKEGDWIVHINVPEWGKVTAAEIIGNYTYQDNLPDGYTDGRHTFAVRNVITFDRNAPGVHQKLSSRLKLRGALWQVYCEDEFYESLKLLQSGTLDTVPEKYHFSREANTVLEQLTKIIQANHPGKCLEPFLADVFRKVPGVLDVKENGHRWGTDFGADLIIKYKAGLFKDLEKEKTLVVQVKSYEGEHWTTEAVEQLRTAIEKYDATMGMIMTTATRTESLEVAFNQLAKEYDKKNVEVLLLAGNEVTQFVLQYGMKDLFGGDG